MAARHVDRRTFLRGAGICIGLPMLDAMLPVTVRAGVTSAAPARRLAFFYVPNGVHMPDWFPAESGPLEQLPAAFQSAADLKDDLLFIQGLALRGAEALGDGPGDHARSMAAFLTGAHPHKTDGRDIRNGISVDQLAAAQSGSNTRFASIELGLEAGMVAGRCDSGYSCAYSSNLSWRTESTPVPKDTHPQSVFDRLFGAPNWTGEQTTASARARRRSILDFSLDEAKSLQRQLGVDDRRKLDEYLYSVRDVEKRIAMTAQTSQSPDTDPSRSRPQHVPREYADYAELMLDLLRLAFQTDQTRIATFVFANEGSQRSYRELGITEGHHTLSHHDGQEEKLQQIARINEYHCRLFGAFLRKMKSTQEGEASLLSQSILVFGSGIQDGNRHNHYDLPILVAGQGAGTIRTGRRLDVPTRTPLTNLYVSLLDCFGTSVHEFGDSSGSLDGLA